MRIYLKKVNIRLWQMIFGFMFFPISLLSQFTSGHITVLQAGDGSTTLVNTGNEIVLKEFSTIGIPGYSMSAPTSGSNALVISGSANSEGYLSLSADGKYLVIGGYVTGLPGNVNLPASTATAVRRGAGLVNGIGSTTFSLVIPSGNYFSTDNIRSATATDKNNVWATGSAQGVNYFGTASSASNIQNTKTNLRATAIFNGQLHFSAQVASGTPTDVGIYTVGSGTPTTAGQTATCVIVTTSGTTTPQPNQFYFNTSYSSCYVADGRSIANGGGIQKWINTAGTWTLAYTLSTGTTSGAFGVVADFSGTNPKVYATTAQSGSNRLIAIHDIGINSTATVLATAPSSNANFRGLAFSPCSLPNISISNNSPICANQTLNLNVTALNGINTYTWSGVGVFNSINSLSPTVIGAASGVYTVDAENACGVQSQTMAVIINPLPALNVNSLTICVGQPATLMVSGADTYTWSTNSNSTSIVVTPAINSTYTVSGTSLAGCLNSATTQVIVTTSPTVTVNSETICSGNSATLTANGVNTFTWSNNSNTNHIVVSPSTNTTYTVSGNLTGCVGTSSAIANVSVNVSPTITILGGSSTCPGLPITLTVSGADTYSWNVGSTSSLVTLSPTVITSYSVVGISSNGCKATTSKTISISNGPPLFIISTPSIICIGETATLTVSGASTYAWNGGPSTSTLEVTPGITTVYTASGTVTPSCKGSVNYTLNVDVCESLNKSLEGNKDYFLFPNPVTDELTIIFNDKQLKRIKILNSLGHVIFSQSTFNISTRINVINYPKGIYFVRIHSENKTTVTKLLIE